MKQQFALSLLALSLSIGASPVLADAPAPPTISVLTAEKKPIDEQLNVTGSFAAGEMVLVTPEIEGLAVKDFLAEEGDQVKKGQILVKLNAAAIDIQLQQATISRDKAAADLERIKKLRVSGVETQASLDQTKATFDLAESQIAGLQLNKTRTDITSPVDGYIATRTVQIGGVASASKSPMYQIVRDSEIELQAEVPESDLPRVKVGQTASITVNGMAQTVLGEVRLISPQINQQTRIGIAHVAVKSDTRIPLGTFGRAIITLAAEEGVALPLTAVTFGDNGPTVQIVKDGKVQVRKVTTGLVGTDDIEITKGVEAGETFVARAGSFVRDGDAVTPVQLTNK
ncbi:MAG: efflux RND transporter periplasmic adaptor subunit [Pseudomonadota bacterium]|nr:efflux RND transporter periplasmic adaptor subunit [Pseudomonadota bacterium]